MLELSNPDLRENALLELSKVYKFDFIFLSIFCNFFRDAVYCELPIYKCLFAVEGLIHLIWAIYKNCLGGGGGVKHFTKFCLKGANWGLLKVQRSPIF